jgi:DNA-binding response OmpR family regulator
MGFCCAGHCAEFAVPIIVLAAHGDDTQHIAALEFGADDYLVEPLSAGVFLARVRTLLRRSQPGALIAQRELLRRGAIVVDITAHRVGRSGTEVTLNKKEFDILTYLMRRAGALVSRNDLQHHAWGHTRDVRTLDVYMMQFRRKLER